MNGAPSLAECAGCGHAFLPLASVPLGEDEGEPEYSCDRCESLGR